LLCDDGPQDAGEASQQRVRALIERLVPKDQHENDAQEPERHDASQHHLSDGENEVGNCTFHGVPVYAR
jgi:hypothetical protein